MRKLNLEEPRGWFNFADFYDLVSTRAYSRLVEVGVWKGHGVAYLAGVNPDAHVYAVDLFERTYRYQGFKGLSREVPHVYDVFVENLRRAGVLDRVTAIQSLSWEAAQEFEDGSVDFVFIDADHSEEAVRKDIAAWYPKVRAGGILAGHDYEHPNHPGVQVAVDEFIAREGGSLILPGNTVWYTEVKP